MTYSITNDEYYTNFINSKQKLTKHSILGYERILKKFTISTNATLTTIITECKNQQDIITEKTIYEGEDEEGNGIIKKQLIKFDVNGPNSKVKQYLNAHINYCKEQKNTNTTINRNMVIIKAFLKYYNIQIPTIETLEDDTKKWYLLEKEDFKYIINESSLTQSSLIKFLMSGGMRIKDALSLTIGDFMEATKEYHNYTDVNEFIDHAKDGMIGTWYFHPSKTIKFKVPCLTFNDPESSNLILQNLRKIKKRVNRPISKKDALFGSKRKDYKISIHPTSVAGYFWKKDKKLKEWRMLKLQEAIEKGELSPEDYDKEVSKIPHFHAHACRKYFETIIAKNCGNLRICTLMEGHVSPVSTDSSYIKQDIVDVKEHYMAAIDDFSLENTEVKVYTSEIRKEMEEKIAALEKELSEKETQVNTIEEKLSNVEKLFERLDKLEKNRIV